jgi:UDP:flavonoid glycosyltransferase YjiC (YdhE family)
MTFNQTAFVRRLHLIPFYKIMEIVKSRRPTAGLGLPTAVILLLFSISSVIEPAQCARILLLCPSGNVNSHLLELLAVGEELVTRGHEVYIPVSTAWPKAENATKRLASSSVMELEYTIDPAFFERLQNSVDVDRSKLSPTKVFSIVQFVFSQNVKHVLQDAAFMETVKRLQPFDLAVVDGFPLAPYFLLVAHVLRIPYVTITGQIDTYVGGSPLLPPFYSNAFLYNYEPRTFTFRLLNTLFQVLFAANDKLFSNGGQYLLTQYAPDVRSWRELVDQSLMFFVTRDHVLERPQPYFPNVVSVPSLTYTPPRPLSSEFEKVYAAAQNGLILVSFGSVTKTIDDEAFNKLLAAFGHLQVTVVMKVGKNNNFTNCPANVKTFHWLPQNDLLGDERTKLFITHGGNNGVYEALLSGVPMLGFPLFGDQSHNVRLVESRGYGLGMNILTFTTDELVRNIRKILTDPEFSHNVKKASAILKDRPMTSRQTVAYWIEHVIKHGHQHLRSHAMDLAWYEYFMVDVLVCVSGIVGVLLVVMWYIMRCCCRCCCGKKTAPKVKAN